MIWIDLENLGSFWTIFNIPSLRTKIAYIFWKSTFPDDIFKILTHSKLAVLYHSNYSPYYFFFRTFKKEWNWSLLDKDQIIIQNVFICSEMQSSHFTKKYLRKIEGVSQVVFYISRPF